MTTTGLSDFNMELSEIIEEAYSRCGVEVRSGWDFKTARRSLNLLFTELANRGINLWLVEQLIIPLTVGTIVYPLPIDTVDILDAVTRQGTGQSQQDINIMRISETNYLAIPTKNAQGRPINFWVNRLSGATYPTIGAKPPEIYVWPTAPDTTYSFVCYRLRRVQNAGDGPNTQDVPFRFLNVIIAGLAFYLAQKTPGVDMQRAVALKSEYQEQLQLAMDEDRDKSALRLTPYMGHI